MEEMTLCLHAAPAAVTDTTAAVIWEKPKWSDSVEAYMIEKNGKTEALYTATDCTLDQLEPDTEYQVTVRALLKDGTITSASNCVQVRTNPKSEILDITAFGAVADGETVNTKEIQAAIDACPFGGTVYVPCGIFRTGALFLKSDMTLYLERGAKLLGSDRTEDYPMFHYRQGGIEKLCHASLINTPIGTERCRNITLDGEGTIDGNGVVLRPQMENISEGDGDVRGCTVCLRHVDGLYLKGITMRNSPFWCTHLIFCTRVSVNGITICSKYDEMGIPYAGTHNGDGLDIDSCSDVCVFHSTIASQDDCIAMKSGMNEEGWCVGIPTERVRVSNCRMVSGFGIVCGSDMSGGVRDILVQDCEFLDAYSIGQVKTMRGRGGIVERICFDNCRQYNRNRAVLDGRWFRGSIYIDGFYASELSEFDIDEPQPAVNAPKLRDITFQNIIIDSIGGNAVYISGLPECHVENITLCNVKALGNTGMIVHHIDNLKLENCQIFERK